MIFILIFFLNISLYSENYTQKVFDLSYLSMIQTNQTDKAYSIAVKAYKMFSGKKWIKRIIESGIWSNNTETVLEFSRKLPISEIPENAYPFIKISEPEFYTEIIKTKLNKRKYLKEYIELSIKLSDDKGIEYVLKNYGYKIDREDIEKIANYILMSEKTSIYVRYINLFDLKTKCDILAQRINIFASGKKYKEATDLITTYTKQCENNYNFTEASLQTLKITDINMYLSILENAYKKELISDSEDIENLFNYYMAKKQLEKAAKAALYGFRKTGLKFFVNYYIQTGEKIPDKIKNQFPEFTYLDMAMNIEKLNPDQRKKLLYKVFNEKENLTTFLWIFYEKGTVRERQIISRKFNCLKTDSKDILNVLSYINLSINENKKAMKCYRKSIETTALKNGKDNEYYLFLERSGYQTEALFELMNLYRSCRNRDNAICLNARFAFDPNSVWLKALKTSSVNQKEKNDMMISYFIEKGMIKKAYSEAKKLEHSKWIDFALSKYRNEKYIVDQFYLPPYPYMYEYYKKNNQNIIAFNYLTDQIKKNPDDYYSRAAIRDMYKEIKNYELNVDFLSSKDISFGETIFSANIYPYTHIISASYKNFNFKNTDIYSAENAVIKKLSFFFKPALSQNNLTLTYTSSFKNTLSLIYTIDYSRYNNHMILNAYLKNTPSDNILSEILLRESGFSFEKSDFFYSENSFYFKSSLSLYTDLNDKKISSSLKSEFSISLYPLRKFLLLPYVKYNSYSSEKKVSHADRFLYYYSRILPESFFEPGIKFSYQFKNAEISFTVSKNNQTGTGQNISGILTNSKRTCGIEISYEKDSTYTGQNSLNSGFFLRF